MGGLLKLEFRLPVKIEREGHWYISICPVLDVISQGKTRDEALTNLKQALQLFIESCIERGTLEQVLRESGFHRREIEESAEEIASDDGQEYINVPFSLIAGKHAEARAH